MPIYLCKPGYDSSEPWKHVVKVYASPFPGSNNNNNNRKDENEEEEEGEGTLILKEEDDDEEVIRRVRHAEIVVVDCIFRKYNRYWLRMVFPGTISHYAGCIPLPLSVVGKELSADEELSSTTSETETVVWCNSAYSSKALFVCNETGLSFPTTKALQLLPYYDDGLGLNWNKSKPPPTSTTDIPDDDALIVDGTETDVDEVGETPTLYGVEPVFCRICREGLNDEEWEPPQRVPAVPPPQDTVTTSIATTTTTTTTEPAAKRYSMDIDKLQQITSSHPSVENPLISPCMCSGSIKFVHYLCIEQWRIRSRHPDASGGTHCETCKSPYSLPPPPPTRNSISSNNILRNDAFDINNNDAAWLDAMPPHVLVALREPHIWWQLGIAIVRRPLLRPLFPILSSPIVALYCRARRSLKKRGVSRRRWSCSLCRRRARWKCVRCLRSYYCSRQCQNVSWHILHKHVCYKSSRFWSSSVFYLSLLIGTCKGLRTWPLLYTMGVLCCILPSFTITGVIGGSFASIAKRIFKLDVRGRYLELTVVLCSLRVSWLMWSLQWAFFGYPQYCATTDTATTSAGTTDATLSSIATLKETIFHSTDLLMKKMLLSPIGRMLTIFNLSLARKLQGQKYASLICGSTTMKYKKSNEPSEKSEQGTLRHRPALPSSAADTTWRRWARQNLLIHEHQGNPNLNQLQKHPEEREEVNSAVARLGLVRDSATAPVCFMQLEKLNPNFLSEHPKCAADMHFLLSIFLMCGWIMMLNSIQRRRTERRAAAARLVMANRRRVVDAVAAGHLHQD